MKKTNAKYDQQRMLERTNLFVNVDILGEKYIRKPIKIRKQQSKRFIQKLFPITPSHRYFLCGPEYLIQINSRRRAIAV